MSRRDTRPRQDAPDSHLPDGTPVFGQLGVLAVDEQTGQVQCAACGRWLRAVAGAHLTAAHGLTAHAYRHTYGLLLHRAIEAPDRHTARSAATLQRVAKEPQLREMLEQGAAAARSGELTARTRGSLAQAAQASARRPERRQLLDLSTQRAAQRNREAADDRLAARARELGFPDTAALLRARHAAGWTVSRISAELGIARQRTARLQTELNLPGTLDARHPVELAALRRVNAADLPAFLHRQHAAGIPVTVSARALGHSTVWLTARARRDGLAHLTAAGPTAEQRTTTAAQHAGFTDAASWLAHRRRNGESSGTLQADTGLTHHRLAQLLRAGGITGPTAAHLQHVLARIGFDTLTAYTTARAGHTVLAMSRELGVGDTFLARQLRTHNLAHLIRPRGRNALARPTP